MAKKKEELNSGHYTQFADRVRCINHMIQEILINNPVTDELLNFKPTLVKIKDLLEDLRWEAASHITEPSNFDVGDRAYCFFSMTEELFVEDKDIIRDKKALAFSRSAANKFWHLYQHLGSKYLTPEQITEIDSIANGKRSPKQKKQ
jgi:hypothetical protein